MAMCLKYKGSLIAVLILILLGILQIHNAFFHPITRGFDADAHIEYITYIQNTKSWWQGSHRCQNKRRRCGG